MQIPWSVATSTGEVTTVHLPLFADASSLACCVAAVAVLEHEAGVNKGLLTSKSRISKRNASIATLEPVGGHMAANMAMPSSVGPSSLQLSGWTVW